MVTTGLLELQVVQRSSQIVTTNKSTQSFFLQVECPSCHPTNSVWALKGKYHIPWTCSSQAHLGVFQLCLWPLNSPLSVCPHLFRGAVMRKGGESSWSGPWHLGCTLEVFRVHSYQDHFIQPGWAECFFCVFSLGLCFVYSFVFLWFVCMTPFFYVSLGSWVISLTVFGASVTNLNKPLKALGASTIARVRS